jgi:hypothetical protein
MSLILGDTDGLDDMNMMMPQAQMMQAAGGMGD